MLLSTDSSKLTVATSIPRGAATTKRQPWFTMAGCGHPRPSNTYSGPSILARAGSLVIEGEWGGGAVLDNGTPLNPALPNNLGTHAISVSINYQFQVCSAQFGVSFQDSLVPAFSGKHKVPVTAIAALIQHNTSGLIALKSSGISRPKDLEGHKYATWDMAIEKAMIKEIIESDGGDYAKLTLIPSTVADAISAIQTNVDSVWVYYAWDKIKADIDGVKTNFIAFKDYAPELDYYNPILIAGNDYLKNNPEEAKAFLRATEKGYKFAMEHPEKAAKILTKLVPELDEKLVVKSQQWLADQYQADAKHWGEFDANRWNAFYDWLYKVQVLKSPIPKGTGFTNAYLPLD